MTTLDKIDVMMSYVLGAKIQVWAVERWEDLKGEPSWNWGAFTYRVKPTEENRPFGESSLMGDISYRLESVRISKERLEALAGIANNVGDSTAADGCNGCKFNNFLKKPCIDCKRNHKDYWRAENK